MLKTLPVFLLVLTATGCATMAYRMDVLRNRASFDLNCPKDQLAIQDLGGDVYGVTGCGTRASYILQDCHSDGLRGACKAIMNSDQQPGEKPSQQ